MSDGEIEWSNTFTEYTGLTWAISRILQSEYRLPAERLCSHDPKACMISQHSAFCTRTREILDEMFAWFAIRICEARIRNLRTPEYTYASKKYIEIPRFSYFKFYQTSQVTSGKDSNDCKSGRKHLSYNILVSARSWMYRSRFLQPNTRSSGPSSETGPVVYTKYGDLRLSKFCSNKSGSLVSEY